MLLEELVREVLVGAPRDGFDPGDEHERPTEVFAAVCEDMVVEVGERHDQANVVQLDEIAQGREVADVVDARHERTAVGVVERRCELVDVDGDRRCAGFAKRGHDVDALPGAREQDDRHDS